MIYAHWFSFGVVMLVASQPGWCYDPEDEPLYGKCRRDPTWQTVDYKECQQVTGWYPQDKYWKDEAHTRAWLVDDKYESLPECLFQALEDARMKYEWARYLTVYWILNHHASDSYTCFNSFIKDATNLKRPRFVKLKKQSLWAIIMQKTKVNRIIRNRVLLTK